jgi:ferredoxin
MALKITDECINCGACQPECPNEAIFVGGEDYEVKGKTVSALSQDFYYIAPEKCTECVGFHDEPMCPTVCPTDACVKDPNNVESHDALLKKVKALHPDKEF